MMEKDMRPNRYIVMVNHAQDYVREFFEQNPISQMCVLAMHDGLCIRVSELSGNPNDHISAIHELRFPSQGLPKEPKGAPSLQNALEMARGSLYHTPKHGTREAVIIFGALLTLDPDDINKTIRECVKDRLRVNIIGMSGTMKICQEICSKTNSGDESCYTVALDAGHLRDLLMATTTPPVIRRGTEEERDVNRASLLMMGFPSRIDEEKPTLCACHGTPTRGGYTCSRCKAKVCGLPVTCPSCGLTLILSTHLARSYHHLFPLRNWVTVSWQRAREVGSVQCKACLSQFPPIPSEWKGKEKDTGGQDGQTNSVEMIEEQAASESSRYECESCGNHFCIDCDLFCHEVVHNCPGCLSTAPQSISNGENGMNGVIEVEMSTARP
jgi:transcription initiation factor TFIIH subunit 2